MCGIIGQMELDFGDTYLKNPATEALKHRNIKDNEPFVANYNTWTGMTSYVITSDAPDYCQKMIFGLTPSWAKRKMYLFNARAEGKLNAENDPNYQAELGIFLMPSFRSVIKNKRCIIPVDYFIEGTDKNKLNEPYQIKRQNNTPFILAGIWDEWLDKDTGELLKTYAIITTAAAPLLQRVTHHRSPLVLTTDAQVAKWLDNDESKDDLSEVMHPFDSTGFIAEKISNQIKTKENAPELLVPVGESIQ